MSPSGPGVAGQEQAPQGWVAEDGGADWSECGRQTESFPSLTPWAFLDTNPHTAENPFLADQRERWALCIINAEFSSCCGANLWRQSRASCCRLCLHAHARFGDKQRCQVCVLSKRIRTLQLSGNGQKTSPTNTSRLNWSKPHQVTTVLSMTCQDRNLVIKLQLQTGE